MTYHDKVNLACNYQKILDELTRQINETKDEIKIKMLWHMRTDFSNRIEKLRKEIFS